MYRSRRFQEYLQRSSIWGMMGSSSLSSSTFLSHRAQRVMEWWVGLSLCSSTRAFYRLNLKLWWELKRMSRVNPMLIIGPTRDLEKAGRTNFASVLGRG